MLNFNYNRFTVFLKGETIFTIINLNSGGRCEDQHQNCKDWAKANFCTLSPDPMLKTCPKSCGICNKVCKDDNPHCSAWAEHGHCLRTSKNTDQTINFMLINCKKSCGVCTPGIILKIIFTYFLKSTINHAFLF